jgi:hypothetical protein
LTNKASINISVSYDGCTYTLVEALKHITSLMEEGYTSGTNTGESASFSFDVKEEVISEK